MGFSQQELKDLGYSPRQLKEAGVQLRVLVDETTSEAADVNGSTARTPQRPQGNAGL